MERGERTGTNFHPYEGDYWDDGVKNIGFKDEYRVDFITNRGVKLIEQKHDKPWFLFLSQLEPHHQNDIDEFVPPKRYEGKYADPYIPAELLKHNIAAGEPEPTIMPIHYYA